MSHKGPYLQPRYKFLEGTSSKIYDASPANDTFCFDHDYRWFYDIAYINKGDKVKIELPQGVVQERIGTP